MCEPTMIAAGLAAAMTAAGAYARSEQQRIQTTAQARAAENEALALRQQADSERQQGEANARRIDRERDALRRDYEQQAGANRGLFAAGNVDLASGSARDALLGDAMLFGEDMAANRYERALAEWETNENARRANQQANAHAARASWLAKSAGGVGDSLLSAGLAGGSSLALRALGGAFGGGRETTLSGGSAPRRNAGRRP